VTNSPKDDYPYLPPRDGAQATPAIAAIQAQSRLWTWILRIVGSITALVLLIALICGTIVGRAAWRANSIASIERFGTNVWYLHQQPNQADPLPEALRDKLGDRWFSDVVEVSHRGEEYFEPPYPYSVGKLTEVDVGEICRVSGNFPKLQEFSIVTDLFSCQQIENWPRLTTLEKLDIESSKLNDADLAIIGRMKGLKHLRIAKANFTAAGLHELARLPSLEYLTLDKVHITPGVSSPVLGFASLTDLVINQSPEFNDQVIELFGSPPKLTTINFNRTPIGDRGLAQLLVNGIVKSLIISEGKLTDDIFKTLANYPAPNWLVLSAMPLTDAGLNALSGKTFPVLILDRTFMTDAAFQLLNNINGVEYVCFDDCKVMGIGVRNLKSGTVLDHLDVTGPSLTPSGIKALAQAPCRTLDLNGANIGDQELLLFVPNSYLSRLNVAETQITDEGLRAFYAARRRHFTKRDWEETLVVSRDPFGNDDFSFLTSEPSGSDAPRGD
jgi:hypothetical protein